MVNFPEYQREPNVWLLDAKRRLIDSMMRRFDISSFYFYVDDDGTMDCVDGRQRIGAILSFLGKNDTDRHDNGFQFRILNEIYEDSERPFEGLVDCSFAEITRRSLDGEVAAQEFVRALSSYKLTVVELSESQRAEEFNLQFARLNLGAIINSGEKLHAMVGDIRDVCFDTLGVHPFLKGTNIQTRRYAREQVAAQILAQIFWKERNRGTEAEEDFARTRHFDLQRLFKEHSEMSPEERGWVTKLEGVLDALLSERKKLPPLRSRAVVVSVVLLAYEEAVSRNGAAEFADFVKEFVGRLNWQVRKGLDVDGEFRYLIDFQRHVTQASVEKYAVAERARVLQAELLNWRKWKALSGDVEYTKRSGEGPALN